MFRRGAMRIPGIPPHDPYLEASRRYAAAGLPSPYSCEFISNACPFWIFNVIGNRSGRVYQLIVDAYYAVGDRLAAERMALATDPLVRLQMAGINPEVASNWQFATFKRFLPSVPGPCNFTHRSGPTVLFNLDPRIFVLTNKLPYIILPSSSLRQNLS